MMIVMKEGATEAEVAAVVKRVESVGAQAHISAGELVTVIGAIGDREHVANLGLDGAPGVDHLVPILKPYKLASLQYRREQRTVLEIDGRRIGGDQFATIAGPCTVESREVLLDAARTVKDAGAQFLRGGAYKPRTSPYSFQGLGEAGLRLLAEAKAETGLPIVTELMDVRDLEPVLAVADVVQLGARNMQNYTLLTEVGRAGVPVLLKRGYSATLEELLMAAEYILKEGNENVMLCERGIRTYEPRGREALARGAALARGGRGRRRRHHRRGPSHPRGGRLRRPAGALRGRLRRLPAQARGGGLARGGRRGRRALLRLRARGRASGARASRARCLGPGHARDRRRLDEARPREPHGRPALRGRPSDRGRGDGRGGARPRRSLPGRRLVPDAARAVGRAPVRTPPPLRHGRRRSPGGRGRRDARPARRGLQPPAARPGQRARVAGGRSAERAWGGAPPGGPELPRHDARGRRQHDDLERHLPIEPGRDRRGDPRVQ